MYSFNDGKRSHAVQTRIRRLLNLSVPNYGAGLPCERVEDRHNRTFPALLCAWEADRPVPGSSLFVVTRDLSSEGVGVLLQQPFRVEQVLLAFWFEDEVSPEPWMFLGKAQGLRRIGGGFWTLGIQLTDYAGSKCHGSLAELAPLLNQLRVPAVLA